MRLGQLPAAGIGHPDRPLLVAVGRNTCWHAPSAEMGLGVACGQKCMEMRAVFCMRHEYRPIRVYR